MAVLTFKRGIHPKGEKKSTKDKKIIAIEPNIGIELIFPMNQHLGVPCEPIVELEEKVLLGQTIGKTEAFLSAPIISSVSGVVKDIRDIYLPNGTKSKAVVIENDGNNTPFKERENRNPFDLTKDEILKIIKENGIVGLGGAGFPTHVKLNPPSDKKIDYFILNAAECEPYLTTDYRVILEDAESLIEGLKIVLHMFPGARGIIGIEDNKLEAIEKLESLIKNTPNIQIAKLQTKYPQGGEKQLIFACLKREVPSGGLPMDIGVIVNNVDTIRSIYYAVKFGDTLLKRVLTVSGGAAKNTGNFEVPIGMTFKDFLDSIDALSEKPPYKIIAGGPMMGCSMFDLNIPIIKTSSAVLLFTEKETFKELERNCIRCSKCVSFCPTGLMPLILNQNSLLNDNEAFEKNNGLDCIGCGSCSYVCPAKRHLAQSIIIKKNEILALKKNKKE